MCGAIYTPHPIQLAKHPNSVLRIGRRLTSLWLTVRQYFLTPYFLWPKSCISPSTWRKTVRKVPTWQGSYYQRSQENSTKLLYSDVRVIGGISHFSKMFLFLSFRRKRP